jgi:hypothetical protein
VGRLLNPLSFFEVYILPVIEIAEDLAKFNWSKIAKGAFDVKKRKVELLEADMKAPGRECATFSMPRSGLGQSNPRQSALFRSVFEPTKYLQY